MDITHIKDEFTKQTIKLSNDEIKNVFNEEVFTKVTMELVADIKERRGEDFNEISNHLAVLFYTHKQPETLYRTLPTIIGKNKNRCYLSDIIMGIFDIRQAKFNANAKKYLLNPNAKVYNSLPVMSGMLSNIGKHYIGSYTLGADGLKNSAVMPTKVAKREPQGDVSTASTVEELLKLHENTPPTKIEVATFAENETSSLTEATSEVVDKLKSGINSIATAVDTMSKKQNLYIIVENRYLSENKAMQVYHIYSSKKLVSSTLADGFAPVILTLLMNGQIKIRDFEEVNTTQEDQWTPPKKI